MSGKGSRGGRATNNGPDLKYTRLASEAAQAIRDGRLHDGDRLGSRQLMDRFGVKAGVAQEGVAILRRQGLIELQRGDESTRGRGVYVVKSPESPRGKSPEKG